MTQPVGLTEAEARSRLAARGERGEPSASRSTASIVRANIVTPFNAILLALGLLTLVFGDWRDALFLAIIVSNSAIGIWQELRAKNKLDALAALVAPRATVVRDGAPRVVAVEDVVEGDVVRLAPGDQVVADGTLVQAAGLYVDESILTGESTAVAREAGQEARSGSFVMEGTGALEVTAVGEKSYAGRIEGTAREFRHPRSPLELAINRLLYTLLAVMVPLGAMLVVALWQQDVGLRHAIDTAVAGMVTLVPEGLVLLASVTYAAAALRMARSGALAQQLNAIESLASVDTVCVDKTGTLTEPRLRVVAFAPAQGVAEEELVHELGRFAASSDARNLTLDAIAGALPAQPEPAHEPIPFLSRRRWSGLRIGGTRFVLGAPELFPLGPLAGEASAHQAAGRRVVAFGSTTGAFPADPDTGPPPLQPLGIVILAEELRPDTRETIAFLLEQGVDVKVLSGDAPHTAGSIAADAGITLHSEPIGGDALPTRDADLAAVVLDLTVVGRISPDGKRRVVDALRQRGRYVAMVGDGVNDVPALKAAQALDRPGLRDADGEGCVGRRARDGRFRRGAGHGRRGPAHPSQRPACDQALRYEVGVRGLPDRRGGHHARRVSAATASSDDRRGVDRRHPRLLPRAGPQRRPMAHGRLLAGRGAVCGPGRGRGRARRHDELPRLAQRLRSRPAAGSNGGDLDADHRRPLSRAGTRGDEHPARGARRAPLLRHCSPCTC